MTDESSKKFLNWVDPDILAYNDGNVDMGSMRRELEFKEFFETGWLDSSYDYLRERWDPLIHDEDPHGRLLGKIALWSVIQLLQLRAKQ
ncbi:MAG TPA: hypothetical protein VMR95_01080 [Candidatus Binatia bacterium]|nr:hypothetical protein [Candidatus Binatia bacterium]